MKLRNALTTTLALLSLAGTAASQASSAAPVPSKLAVYVGTYTEGESKGIYRLLLDPATGTLSDLTLAAESGAPSFLALHPSKPLLYAVNEHGKEDDTVSAFAVGPASGKLTLLNRQPAGGAAPCHLTIDRQGRYVLVAAYHSGSVAVLPIESDGKLGPPVSRILHKGHSAHKERQASPHAHAVNLDASNRYAFVSDLGLDKVVAYRFDAGKGRLRAHEPGTPSLPAGSGPRHFTFAPNGRHAYSLNELASTVTVFDYDASKGTLREVQSVSSLPPDFSGTNYPAEIVARADGRFVYASNRGHDSIAIFAVDERSGTLTPAGHQSTLGKTPRNFTIDPSGTFLLAANQNSDTIAVFRIDAGTGALTPVAEPVSVPRPVCMRIATPRTE